MSKNKGGTKPPKLKTRFCPEFVTISKEDKLIKIPLYIIYKLKDIQLKYRGKDEFDDFTVEWYNQYIKIYSDKIEYYEGKKKLSTDASLYHSTLKLILEKI